MDTVTHGLTGWLLAKAVSTERWGREAKAAVVAGALLPDLDNVASVFGNEFFIRFHRGLSHSIPGIAVTSLLLALLLHRYGRWKNGPGLFLLLLAGQVSHVALDLLNAYGTQLFQPFSDARISFDLLFVVDLAFTAILAAGLWFSRGTMRPGPARFAFGALALYVGFAALLHFRAESTVAEAARRGGVPVAGAWALPRLERITLSTDALLPGSRAEAAPPDGTGGYVSSDGRSVTFPLPAGPFAWNGFVDDGRSWLRAEVDPIDETLVWKDRVRHGQDSPAVAAIRENADVRTWLWFARFPAVETVRDGVDNVVVFSDLRYAGMGGRQPFLLRVVSSPGRPPRTDWSGGK